LNDAVSKTFVISLDETLSLADTINRDTVISLDETLNLNDQLSKTFSVTLDESLSLNDAIAKTFSIVLDESLSLADTINRDTSVSLTEDLSFVDTINRNIPVILEESLSLVDTINRDIQVSLIENISVIAITTKLNSISLNEILSINDGIIDLTFARSALLTESLSLVDIINKKAPASLTETLTLLSSETVRHESSSNVNTIIYPDSETSSLTITESNTVLVVPTGGFSAIVLQLNVPNIENVFIDWNNRITTTATTKEVEVIDGFTINRDIDLDGNPDVIHSLFADTTISGTETWDGLFEILSFTTADVPTSISTDGGTTTTTTFETQIVVEIGSDQTLFSDKPLRLEFPSQGGQGFSAFLQTGTEEERIIGTSCVADNLTAVDGINGAGQLKAGDECFIDDGSSLIIWTTHYTKFGATRGTSTSTGGDSGSSSSGSSGSGAGRSSAGAGAGGFGGILGTPLAINEVSYDKCVENMARILISSDADEIPTVTLHTTRSGTVYATLAEDQPFEEFNEFSSVKKYVFEAPIASDETFMMVIVSEIKGELTNRVQAPVYLTSCTGSTTIVELPEDEEVSFDVPRIFDMKFQIGNGTMHNVESESELFYLDDEDLTVTAIIDSKSPLGRVELRTATLGETDEEYVAIRMNVDTMIISNSTYFASATIPSFFMVEPGVKYWIHILDEDLHSIDSKQYKIGVKPTTVADISVEMDIPTIRPSGSLIKPELYIFNDDVSSYGIVSLVVDGEVVAKKSQLFEIGQTHVIFNWDMPNSDGYSSNDFQGRVDLYDNSTITESALVSSHPRTVVISAHDMESLEIIEKDGQVLADPALIYASNSDSDLRFRVIDPQGQCIIGGTEECLLNENTRGKRGGLESILYGDQILRVRYSGADNALERFSITSIDPITGQWSVSLETDEGFMQQAHAMEDISVKIKYRYHSETITVKSK